MVRLVAPAVIDRSIAAPDLLAQELVVKYVDHLPLYRQEAIHVRSGVAIPRSTLAEWIGASGVVLQPRVDRIGCARHCCDCWCCTPTRRRGHA
jgi:transposase